MLTRSALVVILARVLHVLGLDQNLELGVDGGVDRASRRVASRAAVLAQASHPPVLADARAPALLALASRLPCSQMPPPPHSLHFFAPSRARRSRAPAQMLEPPHSLHRLRCLPCSQMPPPPHSLHWLRSLPCSQMLEPPHPPHSLHSCRRLPCSQMLAPPHSLHFFRSLPCSQMPPPPHSLHVLRRLPCSQMLEPPHSLHAPPHSLHLYRSLPCSHRAPALLALASHASRARRCSRPRTPCTGFAASRARRSPSPGTPCRRTLPGPSRAGTSDPGGASYSPSAVACQDSRTWRRVAARGSVTTSSSGAPRFFTPSCYTF